MSWPHPCSQVQLPACWKDIGEGFGKGVWDFRGSLGPLVLVVTLQWSSPYPPPLLGSSVPTLGPRPG